MRSIIVFAAIALVAGTLAPKYTAKIGTAHAPQPTASAVRPPPQAVAAIATSNSHSVVVPRDSRGHFGVEARVNGRHMDFMVDTGASVIALTASAAALLGIHPPSHAFTAEVRTANGTVRAAPATLDMVEIDDVVVRDVAALVLPDEALSENLLGMSFLSRLRRFEISGGKLVLEQ
jgi:aspartyl protease family protein